VIATAANGCTNTMNGTIAIEPLPVLYSITPLGSNCVNTIIGLNGSEIGVQYILFLDGTTAVDTLPGTGSAISFGPQPLSGTYTILAVNSTTGCQQAMNGTSVILVDPLSFNMTPTGITCQGSAIGLEDSEVGVIYQLRLNGSTNAGSPLAGTGSALNFGVPVLPGIYTIVATAANNCSALMNGSVTLSPLPVAFSISPAGSWCVGTDLGVNGSEPGINYVLILNHSIHIDTIPGNGGTISFGPQFTSGIFTVLAYDPVTNCQAMMNDSTQIKTAPVVFNLTPAGIACSGSALGIDNSEVGVLYQLRRDGIFNVGAPLPGTGSAISFGVQTLPGNYTVEASSGNGCTAIMNGNVTLYPMPVVFTTMPSGDHCPGTVITLNGSEPGVDYILMRDGLFPVDTLAGNGAVLNFGTPLIPGTYTIVAVTNAAGCIAAMNGNTVILTAPVAYNVTPAGINCAGTVIGIDDSETGVTYQLLRNGTVNVGAALPGTGSAISFGSVSIPGLYTVIGVSDSTKCPTSMNGQAVIEPSPLSFTLFPQGSQCSGTSITLNGSQPGIDYVLVRDGIFFMDTISGSGAVLNFGPQLVNGAYTILAIVTTSGCQSTMTGTCTIMPGPAAFNVTPAGLICYQALVGLDGSETGVNYTLYKDGVTTGITLAGTGFALGFGLQTEGVYTIEATDTTSGCISIMAGYADIEHLPVVLAGSDQSVCSDIPVLLNGTSNYSGSSSWTTTGNGSFDDITILNPLYTLGVNDINAGQVELILTAYGAGACATATASDTVLILITPAPVVNAGPDIEVCLPSDYTISSASATGYSALQWTTSGTGNFVNPALLNATYVPSAADLAAGSVSLTLTVTGIAPCTNVISDILQMNFHPFVTVNAGQDETICEGSSLAISTATGSNFASVNWSTTGSGSFTSGNSLIPVYYPSAFDIAAGTVQLIVTASPLAPCSVSVSDTMMLTITPAPLVNAGLDITICEGSLVSTSDATASNYSSLLWSSSGTGSFANATSLNTQYTPSLADIAAGTVTLTLTINGLNPCVPVSDTRLVTIIPVPVVDAGPDALICEGMDYTTVSASAANYSSLLWTSSGTGSFTNGNSVMATYVPSAADIANGSVILTLTANPLAPCTGSVSDSFSLTIHHAATANAGPDASICNNVPFALSAATASNYASVSWTSSGTGNFTNSGILNPVYIPSTADMLAGSVTLTLTAVALPSCTDATDFMVLSITQLPVVDAGMDVHTCTSPYTLAGATATNTASVLWTVSVGTGTLANANTLTPTYTPSATDITNGTVVLILTGSPLSPCPNPAVDSVILTIDQTPVVNAGADDLNCMDAIFTVNDASSSYHSSLLWTTTGTGSLLNATTLNPSYTPSAADLAAGSVDLVLTASNDGCGSVSDTKTITFIDIPVVNAGPDLLICEDINITIGGASATNYSSISWSTSGTGSFANGNTVSPTYTPGAADITSGSVTLTLSAQAIAPCTGVISDQLVLSISRIPVISAGADALVCSTDSYVLTDASAVDQDSLLWTSSGTGSFSDPYALLTTYVPSASDISDGFVTLTLTAYNAPCASVSDSKLLTIVMAPSADAGSNATICNACTYQINTASAPNASTVAWTTSGNGTFSNAGILNPVYQPSAYDLSLGSVILTLTAYGNAPCDEVSDTMTLTFSATPGLDFNWGASCEGQPVSFQVNTTVTNTGAMASYSWDFGDGNNSVQMNPTHLYAAIGHYTVTLTATDTLGNTVTNLHQVYVSQLPVAFFAYESPNCSNQPVQFTDLSHTLYGNIAQWVWNYGDGSPNDTILFPENPNTQHLFDTSGVFNVTLVITNSFGCMASLTQPVNIIPAPVANFNYVNTCNGLNTQFEDASYANGAGNIVGWWWDFGDPLTGPDNFSNQENPMHLFSGPGTYTVTHVARNFNNCTDTIVREIIILPGLAVDFLHHHTCVNDASYFAPDTNVMNVASIISWEWNFGDGGFSYLQAPTHMYLAPGSYDVTLTVTDLNGCVSAKTKTVVVNPAPVAMFNVSQQHCKGLPVSFDDVSAIYAGYIVNWTWDFGDGTIESIDFPANPDTEHTFANSGTYTVTLTITASDSCSTVTTQTLVIEPAPTANFEYDNACEDSPVQFTDLSQTGGTGAISAWAWDFGDPITNGNNFANVPNPVHTFSSTGNFQVSLTVTTANGCSTTLVQTVTIHPAPAVDFYTDAHCANSPVQFHPAPSVNIANVTGWLWDFGDGFTSTAQSPAHIYPVPGYYQVSLTITDLNGCQNAVTHPVHVIPQPTVIFGFSQPACQQSSVQFTSNASASVGYIVRWEWNFGDGTTQTVNFPANPDVTHTYANYGTYNATLTVYTNDSCSNAQTKTITVLQSPVANFGFSGTCAGMGVQFDDLSQGAVTSWNWDFGDPLSGSANTSTFQNPVHTYGQAGTYQVSLTVNAANGCSNTLYQNVTIEAAPVVDFSFNNGCANDTILFNSTNYINVANTSSWFWNFGDNTTSTASNPGHIYMNPGTYTVTLTITNQSGCVNSKTRQVQVTSAPVALYTMSSPACSGSEVSFNDLSSSYSGTINSWHWDFGDGNQLTVNAPANPDVTHVYAASGIYTVSLTVSTSNGCESTLSNNLVVNASPVAAFSAGASCEGGVTAFTDLSQAAGGGLIGSWNWNFGDPASGINNTSLVPSPFHIYESAGNYNVMLVVVNTDGCADTIVQPVPVTPPPAVEFLYSQPSCDGEAVNFTTDPSVVIPGTVATYDWDFGDGSAHSNDPNPSHLFPSAGTYVVTLSISNTAGCENAVSHEVTIHSLPVPQFTTAMSCSGNPTAFSDMSYSPDGSEIISWHWDFGVGSIGTDTSNVQNPVYSYSTAGTYQVSLTITTTTGCSNTINTAVQILPAPQANYEYTAEPCHNGSVIFEDASLSPQSVITDWLWEFRPGSFSTLRDPVYVFGYTDTTFQVKLIVTNGNGCTDTIIKPVYIPEGMEIAINNTETCHGETTWFTSNIVSPAGDSLISFKWNFGDPEAGFSNTSTLRNPSHTYAKAGQYYVSLEATDIHNCTSTTYRMIDIFPLPEAKFASSGGDCDSLVTFSDLTSGAAIETWIWQYGDGASDTITAPVNPNVAHYYTYPGVYFVTLTTISNGGCMNTYSDTVRRTPCMLSAFITTDTLLCQKKTMHFKDQSTCQAPIASWTWDFGDNTVQTFTSPQSIVTHTYTEPGTYQVKLTIATEMVGGAVTASSTRPVGINPAPKSGFTWKDVCIGNQTPFINTTHGNGSTVKDYSWKFGDPMNLSAGSTERNPKYEYGIAGDYHVSLVSSNTIGCYDTIISTVSIYAPPMANFDWTNSCEGKPVYFSDISDTASAAIETWNWYFSDEHSMLGASTKQNPSYDFSHTGMYNAKMVVVDKNGCSDTLSQQVAINASPVAVFSISENHENVQGQIKLNNGTVNGSGFLWDFGNGTTSYAEEPVVQYDKDGDYTIQLITWNGQDCGDTISMDYSFVFKGLYVPNAFAPEDTHQGVTLFKPAGINLVKYHIEVVDRWGNLIWSSDKLDAKGSPVEGWDGTLNNNLVPAGVYLWRAKAIFRDGTYWDGHNVGNNDNLPQTFTGTVTLIR